MKKKRMDRAAVRPAGGLPRAGGADRRGCAGRRGDLRCADGAKPLNAGYQLYESSGISLSAAQKQQLADSVLERFVGLGVLENQLRKEGQAEIDEQTRQGAGRAGAADRGGLAADGRGDSSGNARRDRRADQRLSDPYGLHAGRIPARGGADAEKTSVSSPCTAGISP